MRLRAGRRRFGHRMLWLRIPGSGPDAALAMVVDRDAGAGCRYRGRIFSGVEAKLTAVRASAGEKRRASAPGINAAGRGKRRGARWQGKIVLVFGRSRRFTDAGGGGLAAASRSSVTSQAGVEHFACRTGGCGVANAASRC